jgi:hypothetical protein
MNFTIKSATNDEETIGAAKSQHHHMYGTRVMSNAWQPFDNDGSIEMLYGCLLD